MIREGKGSQLSNADHKTLKSRKLVEEKVDTHFIVTKGE